VIKTLKISPMLLLKLTNLTGEDAGKVKHQLVNIKNINKFPD
jgi:hypothetical protein